jgi:hypothetical protein
MINENEKMYNDMKGCISMQNISCFETEMCQKSWHTNYIQLGTRNNPPNFQVAQAMLISNQNVQPNGTG